MCRCKMADNYVMLVAAGGEAAVIVKLIVITRYIMINRYVIVHV